MHANMPSRFVVVLCLIMVARVSYAAINEFEVVKHLNRLNKPPVKSIQSPDGDIIDCVHISQQTAFDHPSLKNHTIQMKPNVHPEGLNYKNMKESSQTRETITQLWQLNGKCPKGTIPIRRTKKEDILRASSTKNYGKKSSLSIVAHPNSVDLDLTNQNGHEHAIAYVEGEFYGAKAAMNVWNPEIQQSNEFSLSQIWLLGGSFGSDLNSIEAGWQVSPDLYGNSNTRLFTYWTDPEQGNWWMQFGHGHVLGYWPGSLFSYLTTSASMIQWGGEVVNSADDGQHTTTQMGSGHFPEEGFGMSSYFRNVQIVDGSNSLRYPKDIDTFTEQPNCYNVQPGKSDDWGSYIYYGGPGRNPICP